MRLRKLQLKTKKDDSSLYAHTQHGHAINSSICAVNVRLKNSDQSALCGGDFADSEYPSCLQISG